MRLIESQGKTNRYLQFLFTSVSTLQMVSFNNLSLIPVTFLFVDLTLMFALFYGNSCEFDTH